ncbi:MAG: rhomboid family intramembrane serine protease [Verrucomicrobiota bacterium]
MHDPVAYFTFAVIGITCWISYLGFKNAAFERKYIFCPENILRHKEYYRLISSGSLHADWQHLLFNMVSLYLFGEAIELYFGRLILLVIYFAAIIGGNLLSLYLHRHHDYRAYGASGGVCGVIFAYIFLFPGGSIASGFVPIWIPSWLYAILFMAVSFYGMKTQKDNIGHDAHLGGAIIGLFTTAVLKPEIIRQSPNLFLIITIGSVLLFIYLVKNPLLLPLANVISTPKRKSVFKLFSKPQSKNFMVDALLEKIASDGIHSLTKEEHAFLNGVSDKYRRRAESRKPESGLII